VPSFGVQMPTISETTKIPAPMEQVWPLLRDPAVVASCIPGAELSPGSKEGMWRGAIKVKFGPTVASFKGEASLEYDDAAKTCKIQGRGIDGRGASRALASGLMSADGDAETTLKIDGEFNVTGPLETFANAGGVHVARALLAEFSQNLALKVGSAGDNLEPKSQEKEIRAGAQQSDAVKQSTELNAVSLFFQTLKSMIAGLFSRKG
jgi:carbon monoxide dehydrogenase subunit G